MIEHTKATIGLGIWGSEYYRLVWFWVNLDILLWVEVDLNSLSWRWSHLKVEIEAEAPESKVMNVLDVRPDKAVKV